MRAIATDFFARSPAMAGPLIAILLFFVTFACVVAWLLCSKRESFDALAQIPLDGDGAPSASEPTKEAPHG